MGKSPLSVEERFDSRYTVDQAGCWKWTSYLVSDGYAGFWDGKKYIAGHRYAYARFVGPVPEGKELDHLCSNRACVNPAHLEAVSHQENVARGKLGETSRARLTAKTHCKHGHELTQENTYKSASSGRSCRICRRFSSQRSRNKLVIS